MCLQTKYGVNMYFTISAAGEVYEQTVEFVCLGGAICADRELGVEITWRFRRAWACFQRYKIEIYDRPGVRLRLKVRMLKAEVIETLLYGCVTRSPNKPDHDRLTTPCSSDASADGNGSETTTPSRTPTRRPRQTPRAQRRQCGNRGYSWHV